MATPKTLTFGKFLVLIGDGASPEVFSNGCGLTSRGMNNQTNMSTAEVPDCDNEDLPSVIERTPQSQESTISGSGILALGTMFETWRLWWSGAIIKNVQVHVVASATDKGGYWQGPAYLTQFNISADKGGGKVSIDIAIEFDGVPAWTDAV
jgi:hypothetical protein